jgi:Xaa-Pro aminopeptidase
LVNAGRRSAHIHSRQSAYQIIEGDIIKLDVGCTYQFYWSDIGRTKVLGNPTDEQILIHDSLNSGLNAMIGQIKPGVRASEVFDCAVNTIREAGIIEYQRHHCGHGIGLEVYGAPLIQPYKYKDIFGLGGADPIIEEGMVINLEVPYCVLGDYGFIIEDTCVVREDGIELLTHLDKSLYLR